MRAFVDRIEGQKAVLLLGEDESVRAEIPLSWLPDGVREGTCLRVDLSIDDDSTAQALGRVQGLLDSMQDEP